MLYHGYYNEDLEWIRDNIIEGKSRISNNIKLYSGLFAGFFEPEELTNAMQRSVTAGADGVSIFAYHSMKDKHWQKLSKFLIKR